MTVYFCLFCLFHMTFQLQYSPQEYINSPRCSERRRRRKEEEEEEEEEEEAEEAEEEEEEEEEGG